MEEYNRLIKTQTEYKKTRDESYKAKSKDRLSKILKKKVETTMVGALSSIEEHFQFLWNSDDELSEEQQTMFDIYQTVRSEILDKGNSQARNVDAELSQYDIKWLKYSLNIPVNVPQRKD